MLKARHKIPCERLGFVPSAYISLGSNLGDRETTIREAIEMTKARLGQVTNQSSLYETEPVGFTSQPQFMNAIVELDTLLSPRELMRGLLKIELELGRDRKTGIPKGPRTIDLDLVLYDDIVLNTPELTIPHPAMHERRFVLEPLVEIAPDAFHPVFMRSAASLLEALTDPNRP